MKTTNSLELEFNRLLGLFTNDEQKVMDLWNEIVERYSEDHRKYHTLKHLESIFELLQSIKHEIPEWNAVSFAVFYHDIVYDPAKQDNEEKSAGIAEMRMAELGVDKQTIAETVRLILTTKSHSCDGNRNAEFLLDADLSILGENESTYQLYTQLIREEFTIYPDELYNPGRVKVLKHFLKKETIYKTEGFKREFEEQARINLKNEINQLEK